MATASSEDATRPDDGMVKPAIRHAIEVLLVTMGLAVALALALAWRLSTGPVAVPGLRLVAERWLVAQVEGGRADIGGATLQWFPAAHSLGVGLSDVSLVDGVGRPVLTARSADGAIALDSALTFAPAPGRLTARNFFVALSVSPQGRYALGYDAKGTPSKIEGLDLLFAELTGPTRRGQAASYLRQVDLIGGVVALRETAGPLSWRGDVDRLVLNKINGRLRADCRLTLEDHGRRSQLLLSADGLVGLRDAKVRMAVDELNPARVFPSAGFIGPLSSLDAVVKGRGVLEYRAKQGVVAADLTFEAGAGRLRLGKSFQRFDHAAVTARYDPRSGEVRLDRLIVAAERTRLDVRGLLRMIPEQGPSKPTQVIFQLGGPGGVMTLAPSSAPQPVQSLNIRGVLTPDLGRLEITEARLRLAGAPIMGSATLQKSDKPGEAFGLKARAQALGQVGPEQIFAFWPEALGHDTRTWLLHALKSGRATGVKFTADIPPGAFDRGHLLDRMLRLEFKVAALDLDLGGDLPEITDGVGTGVLLGNRIDLTLASGTMEGIALSEGVATLPRFWPAGARSVYRVRGKGEAETLLNIVNRPPWRVVSAGGFDPARLKGQADAVLELVRPMTRAPQFEDLEFNYTGRVDAFELREAALGLKLQSQSIRFEGSKSGFEAHGPGVAGPYRGDLGFRADWGAGGAKQTLAMDGRLDAVGGRTGAPFRARIFHNDAGGRGDVNSTAFDGQVSWTGDSQIRLQGVSTPEGLRALGLPVGDGLPSRFPAQLGLSRAGGVWTGDLVADAYSGHVAWTDGVVKRLRYTTELTPQDAARIGLPALPLFASPQPVAVDAQFGPGGGQAAYTLGGQTGSVDWSPTAGGGGSTIRWVTELDRKALLDLGVPGFARPLRPIGVEALVVASRGGALGEVNVAGAPLKFGLSPEMAGRRQLSLSGKPSDAALERIGLLPEGSLNGSSTFSLRIDSGDGHWRGRADLDLTPMAIVLHDAGWRKPAGRQAKTYVEISGGAGWLTLDRISAAGPGLDVLATANFKGGRLIGLATRDLKIDGLIDGAVKAGRDAGGVLKVTANGALADARPLIATLAAAPTTGAGTDGGAMQIDARFRDLRISDVGVLRDAYLRGLWNGASSRLDLDAVTTGGTGLGARAFPEKGGTAFTAQVSDVGDAAKALFGVTPLRGGTAQAKGRLVPGGLDATVTMTNVRVTRANGLAQILTIGSLRGLADTLNGEGIRFAKVDAPLRLRGGRLFLDDVNASGSALGITARGEVDLDANSMDLTGSVAPAYGINAMLGGVPGLGALLTSHKGEGVVALTYAAKGPLNAPKVSVNPLSLAAPGILRRMFEPAAKPQQRQASDAKPAG